MKINELKVVNTQGDTFNVEVATVSNEGILTIWVNPLDDNLQSEMFTIDILNETVFEFLKDEGFKVFHHNEIK